jgi:response regulator of citrate/malate metabolism
MKIAICEDDAFMAESLMEYVKEFLDSKELLHTIEWFDTAAKFYKSTETYDLIFLDYELPDSNGMEIAKKRINEKPMGQLSTTLVTTLCEDQIKLILFGELNYVINNIDRFINENY